MEFTSDAEVDRDLTRTAVDAVKAETGYEEPRPALETSLAAFADADDDDAPPSAAEMARINSDPKLRETHRSLQRKFHEKTAALAAKRQEYETAGDAVRAIRQDPKNTIRMMAEAAGMKLAPELSVADQVRAELVKSIGEEAAEVLSPAIVASVNAITGSMISPLVEERAQRERENTSAALKAEISAFATRDGKEWSEEIEQEMAALVPKFPPGRNVTLPQYLEILHSNVMAKRGRNKRPPAVRTGMNPKDAVRAAVASARRELGR